MVNVSHGAHISSPYGPDYPHVLARQELLACRRVLVKVGSSLIVDAEGRISIGLFGHLIDQISRLVREGKQVILVSSGSIALGKQILKQRQTGRNPSDRECAAAGQMKIMAVYDYLFQLKGVPASQILLANDDFFVEERRNNLRATIENLLHHGVVPVLNENDVTTHRNGDKVMLYDNDSLASLISVTLDVELSILLTDVDGLFKYPPGFNVPENPVIHTYSCDLELDLTGKSSVGRGGMASKIEAARLAANSSNPAIKAVVIANGHKPDTIFRIVRGELVGTLFVRDPVPAGLQRENCLATIPEGVTPRQMAAQAREASRELQTLTSEERSFVMHEVAKQLLVRSKDILEANRLDIVEFEKQPDFSPSLRARLQLSQPKLETLAAGIRSLADATKADDPIGKVLKRTELADGLVLQQTTAPIGVILVIFESRPDSLPQICSLAFLSGNGLLLKGGKEAARSNQILHEIIVNTICEKSGGKVPRGVIGLIETREAIKDLLKLDQDIDLVIPRGSSQLVSDIQQNTKIPVLGHSEGICHVYLHSDADVSKAVRIVVDSKTDYPAACNAAETLLIHQDLFINGTAVAVIEALQSAKVTLFGGPKASKLLSLPPAKSLKTEYSDLRMTVEVVESVGEAISHINRYGSSHTDTIVTENQAIAERFLSQVDSACVFHNASTRFADGYRFGLGAEVGISTGRIHARGPVGIDGLLTMKWKLASRSGHIVSDFTKGLAQFTHRPLSKM